MCMVEDVDGYSTVLRDRHYVARSAHKCSECRRIIRPGERYRLESLVFEKQFSTHKTCVHCSVMREWLCENCSGFCYGDIFEDIWEHAQEYDNMGMKFLRAAVGMSKRWTKKNGQLMKVPEL